MRSSSCSIGRMLVEGGKVKLSIVKFVVRLWAGGGPPGGGMKKNLDCCCAHGGHPRTSQLPEIPPLPRSGQGLLQDPRRTPPGSLAPSDFPPPPSTDEETILERYIHDGRGVAMPAQASSFLVYVRRGRMPQHRIDGVPFLQSCISLCFPSEHNLCAHITVNVELLNVQLSCRRHLYWKYV